VLPTASCSFGVDASLFGGSSHTYPFSVCTWGGSVRDILGFLMYLVNMCVIWFRLFGD
jgi:hypothetical protein